MTIDEKDIYHDRYLLTSYNVDRFFQANLNYYFSVIQDVAANHAYMRECSLPHLQKIGKTWVVLRTVLDLYSYPKWLGYIDAETWPMPYSGYLAPRGTFFYDSQGRKIAKCFSNWIIMDLAHGRKPAKPDFLSSYMPTVTLEGTEYDIGNRRERLPLYDDIPGIKPLAVHKAQMVYSDSDYNGHINNISYVNWIVQALNPDFLTSHLASHIDISWIKETHLDDELLVYIGSADDNAFNRDETELHAKILRQEADQEVLVCDATMTWKKRELFEF